MTPPKKVVQTALRENTSKNAMRLPQEAKTNPRRGSVSLHLRRGASGFSV